MRRLFPPILAAVLATVLPLPAPASAQDSPSAARAAQQRAAAGGGSELEYDKAAKRLIVRADGNGDLGAYKSGTIRFDLNLHGFKPPDESIPLTLSVFDVDETGDSDLPECQVEVDRVSVNGTEVGTLSGANDQPSRVSFTVPAGNLTPDANQIRVDVDTLGTGCWLVSVNAAEVRFPFALAQLEATATRDVTIKRGKSDDVITDPVWKTEFTASGDVAPANPDDPIADQMGDGGAFDYGYRLGSWPKDEPAPAGAVVRYHWSFDGTKPAAGDFKELPGWTGSFAIQVPRAVGKYTLVVTLRAYVDGVQLTEEVRSHTVYVLIAQPPALTGDLASIDSTTPRAAWLDVATDWARTAAAEPDALSRLNASEYGNPFAWVYFDGPADRVAMVEGAPGQKANCLAFRDVWRILAATLGVPTTSSDYAPGVAYLTGTKPALDKNASANARPGDSTTGDRWRFISHQYGVYGGSFYDPTFGEIDVNTTAAKEKRVFCHEKGVAAGAKRCFVLAPPPSEARVRPTGITHNGWSVVRYDILAPPMPRSAPAPRAAGSATLTAAWDDAGVDADGNGLFEMLRGEVGVQVAAAGRYTLDATLTDSAGNVVGQGDLSGELQRDAPVLDVQLTAGAHTVPVSFSGRSVRAGTLNGPYTVDLSLLDEDGTVLDTATFSTAAYARTAFQGPLVEMTGADDELVDADGAPGAEQLRVSADLAVAGGGPVDATAQLFAGTELVADVRRHVDLPAGARTVTFDFPGPAIVAAGHDGPYTVHLTFEDALYPVNGQHTTAAYATSAFQPPAARIAGALTDAGTDPGGDGKFDALVVTVPVAARQPGQYTLRGTLEAADGTLLGEAVRQIGAGTAAAPFDLVFAGQAIARSGLAGPYRVRATVADAAHALMTVEHSTAAYAPGAFAPPPADIVAVTEERAVDSNDDGHVDVLEVVLEIEAQDFETFRLEATLRDAQRRSFARAVQEEVPLEPGANTAILRFDGGAINAHGVNGPYTISGIELRDGSGAAVDMVPAFPTAAYTAAQFRSAVLSITGPISDRVEDHDADGRPDELIVSVGVNVPAEDSYSFNARLLDSAGNEIVWAEGGESLEPGQRTVELHFDGRHLYGHGVDGPYAVRDFSISNFDHTAGRPNAGSTAAYAAAAFEPSGVVAGTVTRDGRPLAGARVLIAGAGGDVTGADGRYRLTVLDGGESDVAIDADPALAPWRITSGGALIGEGTSATVNVPVGPVTTVDFASGAAAAPDPDPDPDPAPQTSDVLSPSTLDEPVIDPVRRDDPPPVIVDRRAPAVRLTVARTARIRAVRRRGLPLTVSADEPSTARAVLRIRRGRRWVAAGRAVRQLAPNRRARLSVKLSRKGAAALRRGRRIAVQLTVTVTDAAGNATRLTRRATLRRG